MHDKAFWQKMAAAKFALPEGESVMALTQELLTYRSSPDPELRDDIAYGFIARRVMAGDYTPDDYRAIIQQILPDLSARIGESGTDSVMLRSYSALLLSLMVYGDTKSPYLTPAEVEALVNVAATYLLEEKDLRGYVVGEGWLHACAHTADFMKFLARSPHITAELLGTMLVAIANKLIMPVDYVYVHSEDERLAMAVVDILKREILDRDILEEFVNHLLKVHEMGADRAKFDTMVHATYMNVKNFLRALYFRLSFVDTPVVEPDDLEIIFDALRKFPT